VKQKTDLEKNGLKYICVCSYNYSKLLPVYVTKIANKLCQCFMILTICTIVEFFQANFRHWQHDLPPNRFCFTSQKPLLFLLINVSIFTSLQTLLLVFSNYYTSVCCKMLQKRANTKLPLSQNLN